MKKGDVVFSLRDYAQDFIRDYQNENVQQKVIDVIVVDYINYYAGMQCGMDLALYTSDLRGKKQGYGFIDKSQILPSLQHRKDAYVESDILTRVNRNEHMNDCDGKAECEEQDAVNIINAFIEAYMKA